MRLIKKFENYAQDLPEQLPYKRDEESVDIFPKEELSEEIQYEEDDEFVITKIVENFPFDEVKSRIEDESEDDKETVLLDMIVWFRDTFGKEIKNEDYILDRLREEYSI
jgi:hypothetical protein